MTQSVSETLDAHIRHIDKPRPPDGRWHPSGLFACERSALYEIEGVEPSDPKDARSRRILRLGTRMHELVQEAYTAESGAEEVFHEVEVTIPGLGVYGHADTLERFADDDWQLDEWKSIGVGGLRKGQLPKLEHVEQARSYAMGIRLYGAVAVNAEGVKVLIPALGDRLKRIRIAYFGRDDLQILEYTLLPSEEWETEFRQKIARLDTYREKGVLPLRLAERQQDHWLCKSYCSWRSRCYGQDGEGVEL